MLLGRLRLPLISALLLLASLLAPSDSDAQKELRKLRVAMPVVSLDFAPQLLAVEKGFYKAEGLDISHEVLKTDVSLAALRRGDIQFSFAASTSLRAAADGFPIKVVMVIIQSPPWTLFVTPDIKSYQDLKGKSVAGSAPQAASMVLLKELLARHGLDHEKDVNVVVSGTVANSFAALKGGTVQAAILVPPFDLRGYEAGLRPLAGPAEMPPAITGGVAVSTEFLAREPETVKAFLRATLRGIRYLLDPKNTQSVIEFASTQFKLKPEDAAKIWAYFKNSVIKDGVASDEAIRIELRRAGKGEAKPSAVSDFSIVKALAKEMGP